jgi:hypothetical protein
MIRKKNQNPLLKLKLQSKSRNSKR